MRGHQEDEPPAAGRCPIQAGLYILLPITTRFQALEIKPHFVTASFQLALEFHSHLAIPIMSIAQEDAHRSVLCRLRVLVQIRVRALLVGFTHSIVTSSVYAPC